MSEIDSSPEIPKIPENWKFPERNNPGLEVTQIDLDERFVALALPDNTEYSSDPSYKGEYKDYFFDLDGEQTYMRSHSNYSTNIQLAGDNIVNYYINEGRKDKPNTRAVIVDFYEHHPEKMESYEYPYSVAGTLSLGKVVYDPNGSLSSITLGGSGAMHDFFAKDKEGIIRCPLAGRIYNREALEEALGESTGFVGYGDWVFYQSDIEKDFMSRQISGKDNAVASFKSNPEQEEEKVFEVEWKVQRGESKEERDIEYLVVSQIHIPTGIIKIFRAPLSLDMQKVSDAIYSRPPYDKERIAGEGKLVVPWRNMDRIVDASLSYSYPLPTPQK